MRRRRQETLWIHRSSRWMIGVIALMGALGTAYLTFKVLGGSGVACPTGGCDRVLTSPFAKVADFPLTILGFLGYASMATMALAPLSINPDKQKELRYKLEDLTWPLLFTGATAMVIFSGYLMYLLAFEIKAACLYCIASAVFAISMFLLTLLGRRWQDVGQLVFIGIIVGVLTVVGTLAHYTASTTPQDPTTANIPGEPGPPITTTSGPAELQLAAYLTEVDAKMYGAWWCPHCHSQKQLFGAEAAKKIPYIECDPEGQNPQASVCRAIPEIEGFPTWEVEGQFLSGAQPLSVLAEASGYTGPRNFQNN